MIRTRFQPVKFIAKSSSINRKYGEDIKRIVSPCKHELKFTNDTKRSVKLYVSFFRCLRQTIRTVTFFFSKYATDDGRAYAMERAVSRIWRRDGGCSCSYFIVYLRFIIFQLKSREYICSVGGFFAWPYLPCGECARTINL